MTTLEHALVGANLVLASGLNRRFGWQLVAVAGVCAVMPDWDGLTILWSVPLFDAAHRVWGHAFLPCFLVAALFAVLDYRFDFMARWAQAFSRWINTGIPPEQLERRRCLTVYGAAVWIAVGIIAACSHLLTDMVVSGTATLSDWDVKLLWPFSDRGFVYPLVPWGDAGNMLIMIGGMFAMLRWKNRIQSSAIVTLCGVVGYTLMRGLV